MRSRRISSRQVVLTATFLSLAAGGVAACDSSSPEDEWESADTSGYTWDAPAEAEDFEPPVTTAPTTTPVEPVTTAPIEEPMDQEVFYCADEEGMVVEEESCAEEDSGLYLIWYSPTYSRGYPVGTYLDGGDYFPAGDRASRRAFKLPSTGAVSNGTVKTNVVGRSSGGSTTSGGGTSSSGG
ncbi:putative membrane protein YgcG [Actinoplanes campanulatus]|uniref:Putative membrane protein YgcG n=1 Tax=Actinoplanes campanulatus TaxID=113559 RepID=A0A7W5ADP3_9ACTN|nr:hypothetical protein [Actinoplanes campanulatus]MBB3094423.1 putative membrane protein YgcG [Actinoplanes campanulatus]GGN20908.1 hypothetical protein GCM10010109_34860 [Actinoplanes campanulatus]GID35664.1 hypothetical protein Aca09nite_21700 [Actinoplanes campanulatus]